MPYIKSVYKANQFNCDLLAIFALVACSDNKSFKIIPIAGEWKVTEVSCDGTNQSAWPGGVITFEQFAVDSGVYHFPDTPYDSIWHASGSWKSIGPNRLILNNTIPGTPASYDVKNDKLQVSILLPYYPTPIKYDSFVLPVVRGQWTFEFQKK